MSEVYCATEAKGYSFPHESWRTGDDQWDRVVLQPPQYEGTWKAVQLGESWAIFKLPRFWTLDDECESASRTWISLDRGAKLVFEWGFINNQEIAEIAAEPVARLPFPVESARIEKITLWNGQPAHYTSFQTPFPWGEKMFFHSYTVAANDAWARLAVVPADLQQDENAVCAVAFPALLTFHVGWPRPVRGVLPQCRCRPVSAQSSMSLQLAARDPAGRIPRMPPLPSRITF